MFAYQGVFQRHLIKHRENNEINDEELAPYIADSIRLAEEIGRQDSSAVRMLEGDADEEDSFDVPPEEPNSRREQENTDIQSNFSSEFAKGQEPNQYEHGDEEKNGDLIIEEEKKIAIQLQSNANLTGKLLVYPRF